MFTICSQYPFINICLQGNKWGLPSFFCARQSCKTVTIPYLSLISATQRNDLRPKKLAWNCMKFTAKDSRCNHYEMQTFLFKKLFFLWTQSRAEIFHCSWRVFFPHFLYGHLLYDKPLEAEMFPFLFDIPCKQIITYLFTFEY